MSNADDPVRPDDTGGGARTEDQGDVAEYGGGPTENAADSQEAAAEFEADLATLLRERDDLLDTSRRLQADFENYRKRVLREQTRLVERSTEGLMEQLLPVVDSFELAVINVQGENVDLEKVRKGVDLVFAELLAVLEKAGLERIEAAGTPFDPALHEAVLQDEGGEGDPMVGELLRAGWRLKGRVLRPAMVKVVRGVPGEAAAAVEAEAGGEDG